MGYGIKLKELIEEKNLSVRQVANESGIAPTTLYSIISRDTNIRYDYALRIANILDVPVSELCNDIPPSQKDEVEPGLLSNFGGLTTNLNKKTYFQNRTLPIASNYEYEEFPMLDRLIAEFYILNDKAREEVLQFIRFKHSTDIDKVREAKLKKLKK